MANTSFQKTYLRAPYLKAPLSISFNEQPKNTYPNIWKGAEHRHKRQTFKRETYSLKDNGNDTLQQVALINIVAAVNEDHREADSAIYEDETGSDTDSLRNTMAVISNLLTPQDKSVSIPKKQNGTFLLPEETIQKKPVYYKHSEDQEVKMKEEQIKINGTSIETSEKVRKAQTDTMPSKLASSLPVTESSPVYKNMYDTRPKSFTSISSKSTRDQERDPRTTSPTRRLGELKREPRKAHVVPKCNAIDFLDTGAESTKEIWYGLGHLQQGDRHGIAPLSTAMPYIRVNTLPIVFPAKTNRKGRTRSCHTRRSNSRPISSNLSTRRPDSLYKRVMNKPGGYGFDYLEIGNGVNQDPKISSPVSQDSSTKQRSRFSFAGIASKRHWGSRSAKGLRSTSDYIGFHSIARSINFLDPSGKNVEYCPINSQMVDDDHQTSDSDESTNSCESKIEEIDDRAAKRVSFKNDDVVPLINVIDGNGDLTRFTDTAHNGDATDAVRDTNEDEFITCKTFVTEIDGRYILNDNKNIVNMNENKKAEASTEYLAIDPANDHDDRVDEVSKNRIDGFSENDDKDKRQERSEADEFYKVLKVIDPHPYQGYEHRKNRRTSPAPSKQPADNVRSHYIKVKL